MVDYDMLTVSYIYDKKEYVLGKIAEYLRSHLDGEITDAVDVRENFSTDGGLIKIVPQTVVYPYNEQDVRKVARFVWQLAEKGKKVGLTTRGLGSDWSSAAVGDGIAMIFPAHMNKIVELDSRKGDMLIEPGATIGKVNQALITHGLYFPVEPLSSEFSTIGGAIATNAKGMRSAKYGSAGRNVTSLRVVLSNGEFLDASRISKREVRKRMGLSTFEGEIYRGLDAILNEYEEPICSYSGVAEHSPINIFDVRGKDGSVDLTPLFVGSQGTLGIITQAKVKITAFNPAFKEVVCGFYNADQFASVAPEIAKLAPSIFTVVPKAAFQLFASLNPMYVGKQFGDQLPEFLVLLEWDEFSIRTHKKVLKKLRKLCSKLEVTMHIASTEKSKESLAKFFRIPSVLLQSEIEQARAVPGIEGSYIPPQNYVVATKEIDAMFGSIGTRYVSWYDYASGVVRYFPFLDLRQLSQRQKLVKIVDSYSAIIVAHGGLVSTSGGGRVAAAYHKDIYGDVLFHIFEKIKLLFDPYTILNPGVKFAVDKKALSSKMSQNYSLGHRHSHLPK